MTPLISGIQTSGHDAKIRRLSNGNDLIRRCRTVGYIGIGRLDDLDRCDAEPLVIAGLGLFRKYGIAAGHAWEKGKVSAWKFRAVGLGGGYKQRVGTTDRGRTNGAEIIGRGTII